MAPHRFGLAAGWAQGAGALEQGWTNHLATSQPPFRAPAWLDSGANPKAFHPKPSPLCLKNPALHPAKGAGRSRGRASVAGSRVWDYFPVDRVQWG